MFANRLLVIVIVVFCVCLICEQQASAQVSQQFQGSFGRFRGQINNYATGGIYSTGNISPYYNVLALGGGSYINVYQVLRQAQDSRTASIDNRKTISSQIRPQFLSTSIAPPPLSSPVYTRSTGHSSRFLSYDFRSPNR